MFEIDFISAECYPAAKVGGLADVVGSLPKYINKVENHLCRVIIPQYGTAWFKKQNFETVFTSSFLLGTKKQVFSIERAEDSELLGFDLFTVNLPGLFDRNGIYAVDNTFFEDEPKRNIAFQRAYLLWILETKTPTIIHCHDHHTGLIPYMMTKCPTFDKLKSIPTIFTIHNGQYHGAFSWVNERYLPISADEDKGLLDWNKGINSLSSAIRCAWKVTTVSPQYMKELAVMPGPFVALYAAEKEKLTGILNGIDAEVWDPKKDPYLDIHLKKALQPFKTSSKKNIAAPFGLDPKKPLLVFIGRFAQEKGVDILAKAIELFTKESSKASFLVLGTGDEVLEERLRILGENYPESVHVELKYDEKLAHKMDASADFLLMPSRIEPCGLNQMFAMRYGTIPIVHGVGGLEDTVVDYRENSAGNGIKFYELDENQLLQSIKDAIDLFENKKKFKEIREHAFSCDLSWNASCTNYLKLYYELKKGGQ